MLCAIKPLPAPFAKCSMTRQVRPKRPVGRQPGPKSELQIICPDWRMIEESRAGDLGAQNNPKTGTTPPLSSPSPVFSLTDSKQTGYAEHAQIVALKTKDLRVPMTPEIFLEKPQMARNRGRSRLIANSEVAKSVGRKHGHCGQNPPAGISLRGSP